MNKCIHQKAVAVDHLPKNLTTTRYSLPRSQQPPLVRNLSYVGESSSHCHTQLLYELLE